MDRRHFMNLGAAALASANGAATLLAKAMAADGGTAGASAGYAISAWDYGFGRPLEEIAEEARTNAYGVEWWTRGSGIPPLTDAIIERFVGASAGMRVSLHSESPDRVPLRPQIDFARRLGAEVQVMHASDILGPRKEAWDEARALVAYAGERGVKLALENSLNDQDTLVRLLEQHPTLGFCYDVGHGYRCSPPLDHRYFLQGIFRDRLCHVHLQDLLTREERALPRRTGVDHYMVGSGSIPNVFWLALGRELQRRRYSGLLVFEIHPRSVIQLVTWSRAFLNGVWNPAKGDSGVRP